MSALEPRLLLATWLSLLLLVLNATLTLGQESPQHRAQVEIGYESQHYLGKGLTRATLSSGLTVLVRENHAAPVATVRCYVRNTGSAFEGRFLGTGISHMLEHLVALGTTSMRSEAEIQRILDSMGGQNNAFTTTDLTAYYVDCPANRVDMAIELLAQSMQFSEIPNDEYIREMGVVQRELEMGRADRGRMSHQAVKSLLFTEHPIRHPTIGYLPVVQSVKREDVIAFYKNRYVPQNLVFIVVGDVDTQHVLEQTLKNFQTFHRTTERGVTLPAEPDQASPRSTRIEMPGETTNLSIAWPTVRLQHPDLYPLDVASYLLTNGDSSRLGYKLKIENPLAVSVNSYSYTPGSVKGWFQVSVECQPKQMEVCRAAIMEEIERLKSELVSDRELAKVKRQKAAEHVFGQQTVQKQADSLGYSLLGAGDPLFDDRYVEGIQKVTAEQVRDVAVRYFLPERKNTVVVDPIGENRDSQRELQRATESDVVRKTLDNGLTVLLKRHSVTPVVSIYAFVHAGSVSDEDDTSGLAALTSELMVRGTKSYTGREIAEHFDAIGGSLTMNSQRNTSYLSSSVLADDFEGALDYCHQVLFHPSLSEAEFEKQKQQQLSRIAARKADPQAEILDFWTTLISRESPYRRTSLGTTESVSGLTPSDAEQFHRQHFVPNNMVLTIYGDIDIDRALELVESSFGREAKAPRLKLPDYAPRHQDSQAKRENLNTKRENTAMVMVSYPIVSVVDTKTRAALDVVNGVLTGGTGGRLFKELRGQTLVYYVFGFELNGLAPGYFNFLAQTRPETLNEVISRIEANVRRIGTEGVPADEFELTKQKLIARHAQRNTTPASQAFQAALDELYGLGYEHDSTYADRISAVTIEDVREVVNEFLKDPIVGTSSP